MKYRDLLYFDPIDSIIAINEADDKTRARELVRTYVMSDDMAEKIKHGILSQLDLEEVVDNKGVLLVGNYGTGKSHLLSVISAIAEDESNLQHLRNKKFAEYAKTIAGKFEVVRLEIGSTTMSLRNIILNRIAEDFSNRGIGFTFKSEDEVINNKEILEDMMQRFDKKYPGKGYLVIVDELLDYLGGRKDLEIRRDLGFLRELGEFVKRSRFRIICGMQEKLFDNPNFSFVSKTLNRVKDRFEQFIIRKEDTAYVVSERILKKTPEQKNIIRNHLMKFSTLYTNMSENIEDYVELYPIHPSYIDVFNKIYIVENRHVLKNISEIISGILDEPFHSDIPGIISFDTYWPFIKDNYSYRTDPDIKEVVDKSSTLEEIVKRSFPKKAYLDVAIKIIYALSVHRLTLGDIHVKSGLTSENLKDDLCLFIKDLPELDSGFLLGIIQTVLKDIMTTVSGQFIEFNKDSGQYYLDVRKDIDFEAKIRQRAELIHDSQLNRYYFDIVYNAMNWNVTEYVTNFKIYEHTINWDSHNIFRKGYLFMGLPQERSTAQPPEDYYIYFLPPYANGTSELGDNPDEVFFVFKQDNVFNDTLKLYGAAQILAEQAESKNKSIYIEKADHYKRQLTRFLSENKFTSFDVIYRKQRKKLVEAIGSHYNKDLTFKETIDLVASICLDKYFEQKYPYMPVFKTKITLDNRANMIRAGVEHFADRITQQSKYVLEGFGLLENGKVSVTQSKYAQYYIDQLKKLPPQGVINFSDIYEQDHSGQWVDKKFKIDYGMLPVVFLAMVYTGDATITLKNGLTLTPSNLNELPKIDITDLYEFKYIGKPKSLPVHELTQLFHILGLPEGLIRNPNERETGLVKLLSRTNALVQRAVDLRRKLNEDLELWGEPLIAEHILGMFKSSVENIINTFTNFDVKYNTVAKLMNFNLTKEDIEQIEKDLQNIHVIEEYIEYYNNTLSSVEYVKNLELMELNGSFKKKIEKAKTEFREIRDSLAKGKNAYLASSQTQGLLDTIKNDYIDLYYKEHQKNRLNHQGAKRKGEIMNSQKMANLKKLRDINYLTTAKLQAIEEELAGLRVCTELDIKKLNTNPICPHCQFKLGEKSVSANDMLDYIENKIDNLLDEWTNSLLNMVDETVVLSYLQFLKPEQQEIINQFIEEKKLPEVVDHFFVNAIIDLLKGFDPVVINSEKLIHDLEKIGPSDLETFKNKLLNIINSYITGKDKDKLRIVVKRMESEDDEIN